VYIIIDLKIKILFFCNFHSVENTSITTLLPLQFRSLLLVWGHGLGGGAVLAQGSHPLEPSSTRPRPLFCPNWANTTVTFNSVNCQSLLAAINNFACTTLDCCNVVLQTESVANPKGSATNPSLRADPHPSARQFSPASLRFFKDLKENSSRKDFT